MERPRGYPRLRVPAALARLTARVSLARAAPLAAAARQFPVSFGTLTLLATLTLLLNRYLHIFMVFWSFLAGLATFYYALSPETLVPNLLFLISKKQKDPDGLSRPIGCAVCGDVKCNRHRPTLSLESMQPWLDLKVPQKVDASLAELLELVLKNFIYPWYSDFTDDEALVDELRLTMRFAAAVLLRRTKKVDVPSLITDKLLKVAMKHIEIVVRAKQKVRNTDALQQAALEEYGPDLHLALRSRRSELRYLRTLTEMLLPQLIPHSTADTKSLMLLVREVVSGSVLLPLLDQLASPDFVNFLILLFLDETPMMDSMEPSSPLVPFLEKFVQPRTKSFTVLKLELKEIRKTQELLFLFMKFLKSQAVVHVLQFCLSVEDFNDKLIRPDLNDTEMQELHAEVCCLYRTYCCDGSVDKIKFDPAVVAGLATVVHGPYADVVRLQNTPHLFQAYEHVLALLENVFTPMFWQSDEYFRYMIGDENLNSTQGKMMKASLSIEDGRQLNRRGGETFGIGRISSKFKHVFKSNTLEGGLPVMEDPDELGLVEEANMVEEDDFLEDAEAAAAMLAQQQPPAPRDLSSWRVCAVSLDVGYDDARKEKTFLFLIEVQRLDGKPDEPGHNHWTVKRKYDEFYALQTKLTEFHGSFPDAQLPPKKVIGSKGLEFMESKTKGFELYLQSLLQHPTLTHSQLLVDFLSRDGEAQFSDKTFPDVNIGKIFKAVPRLMKERGQHLEPFIQSFVVSCEAPKPKPGRNEITVLSPSQKCDAKIFSPLFGDNASRVDGCDKKRGPNFFVEERTVSGIYDYLLFVGRIVFKIPDWLHQLLMGGRILLKHTLEAYCDHYLAYKIGQLLQEHRLEELLHLLRDVLFFDKDPSRTPEEQRLRAQQTFQGMMAYIPDMAVRCIGEDARYEGIKLLFDGLQQPLLNKQLTYLLLDIVVLELFPEIDQKLK
uniref:Sorting nexin-14 isoform X2 n=1 Tax=Petromyzon marinus TaxID=7757 RepID=A0AAJ7XCV6_PETMA|nr:sorting nexin-14 isoform X2 [Petromyzon marinus]